MLTMNDFCLQQHLAHEIYRQKIMQRIPDPFPAMLPMPIPHRVILPPRPTLPGVEAKLENNDLWKQFHKIGTEMIITKSGRRMFPSMRISLAGLEEESNYFVLLEMVPIGDCRYKFSGSQWVPAGGAEPQSPQRWFIHPDSPATGAHWQAQAILFNKVKLTNNTLDGNGHIVLASMHKYQPRLHIIRTSDFAQIAWAPQQAFIFPETEFVAVTAYQNDRITKLKIDNNPFAKGFRETGQSRCKRKLHALGDVDGADQPDADSSPNKYSGSNTSNNNNNNNNSSIDDDRASIDSVGIEITHSHKRLRSQGSLDDFDTYSSGSSICGAAASTNTNSANALHGGVSGALSPVALGDTLTAASIYQHQQQQMRAALLQHHHQQQQQQHFLNQQAQQQPLAHPMDLAAVYFSAASTQALFMEPQGLLMQQLDPQQQPPSHSNHNTVILPPPPAAIFYGNSEAPMNNNARLLMAVAPTMPEDEISVTTPGPSPYASPSLPPSPSSSSAPSPTAATADANHLPRFTQANDQQLSPANNSPATTTPAASATHHVSPAPTQPTKTKRNSFSISAILAY